ncbi:MAG: hypothetical protein KKF48_04670 [Nanoarchaeota archaeon]|nr:hypothetical protein [Nanoarchaeota archaeon]MBU1028310.1 hypothetical protein [Nanoarchaeota archaeon]
MTQTEKPATKAEQKKQGVFQTPKANKTETAKIINIPKSSQVQTKKEIIKDIEKSGVPEKITKAEEALDKKETKKQVAEKKPIIKKNQAIVRGVGVPISTKESVAISKFIKRKKIEKAISDLEQVLIFKKAIPMKGEIPHRKGRIGSGRYPQKAVKNFIKLLKSLLSNSHANGLEDPIIAEAISNIAVRPFGRFGRVKRKRTHIKIIAKSKKELKKSGGKQNRRKKHS